MLHRSFVAALLLISGSACSGGEDAVAPRDQDQGTQRPALTPASGTVSTLLGRSTFSGPTQGFNVKRSTGSWRMEISAKSGLDLAVQSIDFPAGSESGWHRHPGPVFIQIVTGTITFYEADDHGCHTVVRTAGQGYLDAGDHAHLARNESSAPAQNIVTYFAPPGARSGSTGRSRRTAPSDRPSGSTDGLDSSRSASSCRVE